MERSTVLVMIRVLLVECRCICDVLRVELVAQHPVNYFIDELQIMSMKVVTICVRANVLSGYLL
jgi:hypothetical protein